jgi:hypothetical protein
MKELTKQVPARSGQSYSLLTDIPILLTAAAVIGIVYMLTQADQRFLYLLSNGLPPMLSFVAFTLAVAGLVRNGVKKGDRISTVWFAYSIGMLSWFLGESTWAIYALWYSTPNPFPSIADVFWLAGYAPLIFAILIIAWPFREFLASRKMLTVILTSLVSAGLLLVLLIPPTYANSIGNNFVSVVIGLSYPLLDVALLVVALPILFLYGRGTFWRPFLFITAGLILTFVGDTLFSWASLNGVYYDGSYIELFFHWSYLALAYGFYLRYKSGTGTNMLEYS